MMPVKSILLFGEFSPPLLTFARSCKKNRIQTYLLDLNPENNLFGNYSSALQGKFLFPREYLYTSKGIEWINRIARQVDAQAIAAVSDSFNIWLSKNRSEQVRTKHLLDPVPLTSSHIVLEDLSSKQYQNALAEKHGLTVLDSWNITCREDISFIPEHAYPVCLRPSDPNLIQPSFKAMVCENKTRLKAFVSTLVSMEAPIIAQSYKDCPNMILCMVRDIHGKVKITESFLVEKKIQGFALKISKFQIPEDIIEKSIGLVKEIGIVGPMHFDFLYHDGTLYFLEINARLGGVTDKVFRLGYDEPQYAVNAFFDTRKKAEVMDERCRCHAVVNKKAVCKYILFSLSGRNERIDYPSQAIIKHLAGGIYDLFMVKDSIFDPEDLRGYFWFYFQRK